VSERAAGPAGRRIGAAGAVFRFLVLALLALAAGAAAAAEPQGGLPETAGTLPIEITADRLFADSGRERVTFEGSVVATQGEVTLFADRLFAEYAGAGRIIEVITAEGNVRVLHEGKEARAARGVFYNLEQRIVLTGGADLRQGENTLKGDTVTIYLKENRSVVTGGENGRVRAVIHPQGFMNRKEQQDR
jgi:lipopolysaccharide export system protein LptA